MKKALAILMTLALVASAATAEITWGAWGRGVFVAAQSDGTDTTAVTEASWSGNPRIGFSVNGAADNMGFHVDLTGDVASVGIGDQAKIWWKGNDMFKLEIGKVYFDALRGKIGDQSFARYIAPFNYGEDQIFTRFQPGCGAVVEVTPAEGVVVAASVDPSSTKTKAETVYQKIQVGAGYTIAGVGQIRAQYVGNTATFAFADVTIDADTGAITVADNAARIEAAFAYTGVEGLTLDVGGKYYLPVSVTESGMTVTSAQPINASVGANFKKDAFGLFARVDAGFAGSVKATGTGYSLENATAMFVKAYVIPSYALDFATIGCDIAYGMTGDSTTTATITGLGSATTTTKGTSTLGFCPYIQKGNSNGYIKAGFAVQAPMNTGDKLKWAVPVVLEYWF
jgi:hypothetical protein